MERATQLRYGLAALLAVFLGYRLCTKDSPSSSSSSGVRLGLSAPIAAAYAANGDVIVAGLDANAKAIRVQRINSKDEVVADRAVLPDVEGGSDADLKVAASADGAAFTWRGLRSGKLVRQLVVLTPDLEIKGTPGEVSAASCATNDTLWFSDGAHAVARSWSGASTKVDLPKEKETSLLCSTQRAFAVLEDDDRTSILPLTVPPKGHPITLVRESEFGEEEQRELAEYAVGEDVGVVRLSTTGSLSVREILGGELGPLHKLSTTIPKDDDVVAVDASARTIAIVYTQDASTSCEGDNPLSTKVTVLRVDRKTFEESTSELSPGRCGHEVGPFFTGVVGEAVSIAWAERAGGEGRPRAPVVALAHSRIPPAGTPKLARIDIPAETLVDAMCDGTQCYAVALVRNGERGAARVLRY